MNQNAYILQNYKNVLIVQVKTSSKTDLTKAVLHSKFSYGFDFEAVRRLFLEIMSLCGISRVSLISYYQVYKELNLCFLLMPNFKIQVADKQ